MTLTEFLLARLDEDEAAARDAKDRLDPFGKARHFYPDGVGQDDWGVSFYNVHPARVLAEVTAKRQIVESCRADYEYAQGRNDDTTEVAEEVLWALALPYADHEDYRAEWGPA